MVPPMIWFFERTGERLQCEIRQASSGAGYEMVWTTSRGRLHIERSNDPLELMRRRTALEYWLKLDGWTWPGGAAPQRPGTPSH
jgi:hypothetical protein